MLMMKKLDLIVILLNRMYLELVPYYFRVTMMMVPTRISSIGVVITKQIQMVVTIIVYKEIFDTLQRNIYNNHYYYYYHSS